MESRLDEVSVRAVAGQDNGQLDVLVLEEVMRGRIMLRMGEVDRAVAPFQSLPFLSILGGWTSLQESVDLQVGVRQDEGQVEALRGEAIPDNANFDGRHNLISKALLNNAQICVTDEPLPRVLTVS